jgi:hypothetical protein
MIGFEVFVYRADLVADPRKSWPEEAALLVSWEVGGFGGLSWIDDLVTAGKAVALGGDGYPLRYTALARDLLPVIANGIPRPPGGPVIGEDYFLPAGWVGQPEVAEKLAECPPNQLLLINAWDQS